MGRWSTITESLTSFNLDWEISTMIVLIVIGAFFLTRAAKWVAGQFFNSVSGKFDMDTTRYHFLKNALSLIIWSLAFATIISMIPKLRSIAVTLFAGAGIMVVILGLAAQKAFSNIISGIVMVIFEPFKVGDVIDVNGEHFGMVEDITLRHTVINNLENKRVILPNSYISAETITNHSIYKKILCRWVDIGISYDSDVNLAISIIQEEAEKFPQVVKEPKTNYKHKVNVRVLKYGDSSVNLRAYVWSNNPKGGIQLQSDILKAVKARFDLEGIVIPFPHRTLVFKGDTPNKPPISDHL